MAEERKLGVSMARVTSESGVCVRRTKKLTPDLLF